MEFKETLEYIRKNSKKVLEELLAERKRLKNTPLKECKWCNGSGYDQEHIGYKCRDCNGTDNM